MRYIYLLLALAAFFCLSPFAVAIDPSSENSASVDFPQHIAAGSEHRQNFSKIIDEIYLYEVIRGKIRKTLIGQKDLENRSTIACDGYICGVEFISKNGRLAATLEERSMDIIAENEGRTEEVVSESGIGKILPAGKQYRYAYFPKVSGDAVSMNDYFSMSIKSEGDRYDLLVRQNGYQVLSPTKKTRLASGDELQFHYLGADMAQFETSLHDFKDRLASLSDGIEFVEKAVGGKLVSYVNIVEYQGADNALTSWGQNQVWIYADTFRNRQISELRSMAEHEALHIFIDRQGYARQTALRGFFSDLHGFEPLSLERFSLVTRGMLPPGVILPIKTTSPLFAFINERNFIPGMSGGHSGDSLDEFCASFLHALLYIDQLPNNMDKSELVMGDGSLQALSAQGRETIILDFRRAIDMFMASSSDDTIRKTALFSTKVFALFDKSMNIAARVNFSD
ncbi:MAG: hypothetical protein R6W88_03025 [Desulfobacterales bacterium]